MFTQAHQNLFKWYQKNGRHDLPWRQTDDAYHIYVSEIMLQQTQVATVRERFYTPFLEAFPTFKALSVAHLDQVLKQWEGLGYYRRAKHLHEAAQSVAGVMPQSIEGLEALKGVGKSTAHAVACFAYGAKVPILDANVKRILYRIFAQTHANDKTLWDLAYRFFDATHPYEFNQALMDIGSQVCTKNPQCSVCPLEVSCLASSLDPKAYPAKKAKKTVPERQTYLYIYKHLNRLGLMQRRGDFLHGLWGFEQRHEPLEGGQKLGSVVQKYTHFHLEAEVFLIEKAHDDLKWYEFEAFDTLALSGIDHKALKLYESLIISPQSI